MVHNHMDCLSWIYMCRATSVIDRMEQLVAETKVRIEDKIGPLHKTSVQNHSF